MEKIARTKKTAPPERDRRQRVQSASTGLLVLKELAACGGRATLTALAARLDENPAKVHRYLASLMEESFVTQERATQQYVLGPQCISIGLAAIRMADPIRLAEPSLVRLRERLEVTCFVAIMGNRGPTIMRFEEPGLPVTVNVRAGSVMSLLWSATGRLFLALLDEPRVRQLAEDELASAPAELRAQLDRRDPVGKLRREIRAAGLATVCDTNLKGISAVSAPLFDANGHMCAAITALGATGGFDASIDGPVATSLRHEAGLISGELGYRTDPDGR
ncbi:IclR family transcriptional regulator [Burkholderia sp. AU42008]|uniref:IclR family transcriptional regulator n=1 Tax=unclassified Burkholderia TaxID=2613784 RepID=UPI000B7A7966|nr:MULTISPECIES: IclR family transcriptional regulator [unclassified Burkholderia]MBR8238476.1 IclR family transcriptional regulator [Burkholderia sp. AU32357]MBY4876142.1 IclR family transcriptional regulator [Burkholderia sp. AU42008]OXI38910.1 IclR family transcriptional regulator [Burkholderia sp. AU17457]